MVHVWSINSGERFQGHHGPLVSFSYNVFKRILLQGSLNLGLFSDILFAFTYLFKSRIWDMQIMAAYAMVYQWFVKDFTMYNEFIILQSLKTFTTKSINLTSSVICCNYFCFFFNPFPHNNTFLRPLEASLLKTLSEKEKLRVTSNFSFSHSVFYWFE